MQKVVLQPAYILHTRPYRDTSTLLDAFTPEHGRVGLLAKGARGPKSRLRGLLQPFRSLLLSWTGSGELHNLASAEEAGLVPALHKDRLISGLYVNELVMRLTQRNDPQTALFGVYSDTLLSLAGEGELEPILRIFEKRLLEELGYGLLLDREGAADIPIEPRAHYRYVLEVGPLRMTPGTNDPGQVCVRGETLVSLHREELRDALSLSEAKSLMRSVLRYYLGEKPLKSRELIAGSRG